MEGNTSVLIMDSVRDIVNSCDSFHNDVSIHDTVDTGKIWIESTLVTIVIILLHITMRSAYERCRLHWSFIDVTIVGMGPVGLISSLIALKSHRVKTITLYDQSSKTDILNKPYQIALDSENVKFLRRLNVDFDNLEGCWKSGCFFTRVGVLSEYLISLLTLTGQATLRFDCKFNESVLPKLKQRQTHRGLYIICDGADGQTACLLGLSDEYTQHSCKAYAAVATIERKDACAIPIPEIRIHNLTFNLSAYLNSVKESNGKDLNKVDSGKTFHFKIFGSKRHRYLTLAVPKVDTRLVKTLKSVHDRTVMRNIFQVCFNAYKSAEESDITDTCALRHMRFSSRLFDVKLSERQEVLTYLESDDVFVLVEGDAARTLNLHTGMDVNVSLQGLTSLSAFIHQAALADSDRAIEAAMLTQHNHSKSLTQEYLAKALHKHVFTG